jgi:hypothetical protein
MRTPGPGTRRVAGTLAGAGLLLVSLAGAAPESAAQAVTDRLGPITVSATALRPAPRGALITSLQISTSGQLSDQLDAVLAAGRGAVAVYHQRVAVGELTDLASCDGASAPPGLVNQWLHDGPLLVPGRSGGPSPPADATLTLQPAAPVPAGRILAITLYFAHAGAVTLHLPVAGGS